MDLIVYGASNDIVTRGKRPQLFSFPRSSLTFEQGKLRHGKYSSDDFRNEKCVALLCDGKPIHVSLKKHDQECEYTLKLFAPRPIDDGDDELVLAFHISTITVEPEPNRTESEYQDRDRRQTVVQSNGSIGTLQKKLRVVAKDLGLKRPLTFCFSNIMYCESAVWQRAVEMDRRARH